MVLQQRRQGYFLDKSVTEPLTEEEERRLLIAFQKGDYTAKEELICRNLRLVAYISRRFSSTGLEVEDLISIGTIGLIKAINTYNLEKEIKLATYVARCIENEILMHLRATSKYKQEVSIEDPISTDWEGNELTLLDVLEVEDQYNIYEDMERASMVLEYILNGLYTREKLVILLTLADVTQRDIGKTMDISQSYISRIIRSSQNKLARLLKIGKPVEGRWSVQIINRIYLIQMSVDSKHQEIIEQYCKEAKIRSEYNGKKMKLYCYLDECTYELLANIVKIIET